MAGCTNESVKADLLPKMAEGRHRVAFAHEERGVPLAFEAGSGLL